MIGTTMLTQLVALFASLSLFPQYNKVDEDEDEDGDVFLVEFAFAFVESFVESFRLWLCGLMAWAGI